MNAQMPTTVMGMHLAQISMVDTCAVVMQDTPATAKTAPTLTNALVVLIIAMEMPLALTQMVPGRVPATQVTLGMVHPALILMSAQITEMTVTQMQLVRIPLGHGCVLAI
jgi:hypothetical protein